MEKYFAIVNPTAGGGRCGKLAAATLEKLKAENLEVEVAHTARAGDASRFAREAYQRGIRNFIAVGGDGTSYEMVNGLFPLPPAAERVSLGFLPLGTGNSFLRDFADNVAEYAIEAIAAGRARACDVIRLKHRDGVLHYINLMSVGFTAEAGELTNRRFKRLGEAGYLAATLLCWLRLHFPVFPLRLDGAAEVDQRPCIYLTFSNSRFTGGKLMIAPFADTADGLIEVTRVGPIGRWDFALTFPKIFSGAHMSHPLISRAAAHRVDFRMSAAVDVMIDGEIVRCEPQTLEVLPLAMDVMV